MKKKGAEFPLIIDSTLRDGEQAPGVAFTRSEKLQIARMLSEIGITKIEAGTPAVGVDERVALREIVKLKLKARIIAWSRATVSDIEDTLACGVDAISISIPASDILLKHKLGWDREYALWQMEKVVRYAVQRQFGEVAIGAEDASRADPDFLVRLAGLATEAGACRLRFADTLGVLDPFRTFKALKKLVAAAAGLPIEFHAHNDFGMATANSLAAVKAGVQSLSTTVCGLGERAGNAPLEEVVMALKYHFGLIPPIDTCRFKELAALVSSAARRDIPVCKPVVGDSVFAHESGIHVNGLLKSRQTYQYLDPEEVGQNCRFVVGKHSGTSGLMQALEACGIIIAPAEARLLLAQVRRKAVAQKRALSHDELVSLYRLFHT